MRVYINLQRSTIRVRLPSCCLRVTVNGESETGRGVCCIVNIWAILAQLRSVLDEPGLSMNTQNFLVYKNEWGNGPPCYLMSLIIARYVFLTCYNKTLTGKSFSKYINNLQVNQIENIMRRRTRLFQVERYFNFTYQHSFDVPSIPNRSSVSAAP